MAGASFGNDGARRQGLVMIGRGDAAFARGAADQKNVIVAVDVRASVVLT